MPKGKHESKLEINGNQNINNSRIFFNIQRQTGLSPKEVEHLLREVIPVEINKALKDAQIDYLKGLQRILVDSININKSQYQGYDLLKKVIDDTRVERDQINEEILRKIQHALEKTQETVEGIGTKLDLRLTYAFGFSSVVSFVVLLVVFLVWALPNSRILSQDTFLGYIGVVATFATSTVGFAIAFFVAKRLEQKKKGTSRSKGKVIILIFIVVFCMLASSIDLVVSSIPGVLISITDGTTGPEPPSEEVTYVWNEDEEAFTARLNYIDNADLQLGIKDFEEYEGIKYPVIRLERSSSDQRLRIKSVSIPDSIIYIGDYAFYNCEGLTQIIIPNSVESVGTYAFAHCRDLEQVKLGSSVEHIENNAFAYCEKLTSCSIPNSVKEIGVRAFEECSNLTGITIPNSVISIGERAFYNCTSLQSVAFNDCETSIGEYVFAGCTSLTDVNIPSTITSIGEGTFSDCNNLESIVIPFVGEQLEGAENTHFGYMFGASTYSDNNRYVPKTLKSVTITGGSIANYSFYDCESLEYLQIGDGVVAIGDYSFANESSLRSVIISHSINSIGFAAFANCNKLESLTVPFTGASIDKNTHLGYIFGATEYNDQGMCIPATLRSVELTTSTIVESGVFYACSIAEVILNDKITQIKDYAFAYCKLLQTMTIPTHVNEISEFAFVGCENIQKVYWNATNCSIAGNAGTPIFEGCSNLSEIKIGENVVTIPSYAFANILNLNVVVIPENVQQIGLGAFANCNNLESITLPFTGAGVVDTNNTHLGYIFGATNYINQSDYIPSYLKTVVLTNVSSIDEYAFYKCVSIVEVTMPDGVIGIGDYAFSGSGLTNINIGNNVVSIGNSAFADCSNLSTVYWNATTCEMAGSSTYPIFKNCSKLATVVFDEEVKIIPDYAFYACSNLISITLPDGVTSIGDYAFYGCSGLADISIPDSVTNIGSSAFYACSNLVKIKIGNGVTTLNGFNFPSYSNLLEVSIGNSVTSISNNAFQGCSNLTSVTIGTSVTDIRTYAFASCSSLTNIIIPDNVIYLRDGAFWGCGQLASVTIGKGVTEISYGTFRDCSSLTNVTMGNNVTSIGISAFENTSIANITIPSSVTSIGAWAFQDCRNLTSITIPRSVKSIGVAAFCYCSKLKTVVFENPYSWWRAVEEAATSGTSIPYSSLTNSTTAAQYLTSTYYEYYWRCG